MTLSSHIVRHCECARLLSPGPAEKDPVFLGHLRRATGADFSPGCSAHHLREEGEAQPCGATRNNTCLSQPEFQGAQCP